MRKYCIIVLLLFCPVLAFAQFSLTSSAFKNNSYIPYKYGLCQPNGHGRTQPSDNISPPLKWSGAPEGTLSYVLLMADHAVPEKFALKDFYQVLPAKFPRETDYFWLLVNIPQTISALPAKAGPNLIGPSQYGIQGVNYYSRVGGADMGGYGGPCPPVNDTVLHHYIFTLYAVDQRNLNIPASGAFTGTDVLKALQGHVLAKAVLVGKYSTRKYNRDLK